MEKTAITTEWNGRVIRVMNPVLLAASKLDIAFTVPQTDRQDVAHLKILIPCVRGFLRTFLREIEQGNASAQGWIGAVNAIWKLSTSTLGRRAARKFGINWLDCLPSKELTACKNEKLARFRDIQLPRWNSISLN